MKVWAREDLPIQKLNLKAGMNDIPDEEWDKVKGGNRVANLTRELAIKVEDTPAAPPPSAAPPKNPRTAGARTPTKEPAKSDAEASKV